MNNPWFFLTGTDGHMEGEDFFRQPEDARGRHILMVDLIVRREKQLATEQNLTYYPCPCSKCHGGHRRTLKTIDYHREKYGRDQHIMHSILGGDPPGGFPPEGIWVHDNRDDDDEENFYDDAESNSLFSEEMDPYHDVQQQMRDAFGVGDQLREQTVEAELHDDVDDVELDDVSAQLELLDELSRQATRPLYDGLNVSIISATIVLVNMAVVHSVPNEYLNELLKYLGTILLPRGNQLPLNYYEAKNIIKKLGLNYKQIHACPNGCILYRKEYEDHSSCPKEGCGRSRYMPNSRSSPAKVVRWFPFIPRVLRMFRSPAISKLLRHHIDHPNNDESVMKSVADSPAWKHVTSEHVDPSFALEPRNLRLGLSLDGVNPFPHSNTTHSTWPVLLLIYNLPPYLVTKIFFIQLGILISGKESPTSENIGVFIEPLLEELQLLWTGVMAQDFLNPVGERLFHLRGILMWTISDYPALGLISGLSTHGYKACVACGPETEGCSAKTGNTLNDNQKAKGRKIVYGGGRRWTRRHHPYRRDLSFNGKEERRDTPVRMTGEHTMQCAQDQERYLRDGGRKGGNEDPVHVHGVKHRSCLDALPYWKVSIILL